MIRVGIVGAGPAGLNHFEAFKIREKSFGDVTVAGFAEIDPARRAEIEARFGVKGYPDHRSLIRRAGRILVLRRGRLVDQGRHEELLGRSADYRRIFGR